MESVSTERRLVGGGRAERVGEAGRRRKVGEMGPVRKWWMSVAVLATVVVVEGCECVEPPDCDGAFFGDAFYSYVLLRLNQFSSKYTRVFRSAVGTEEKGVLRTTEGLGSSHRGQSHPLLLPISKMQQLHLRRPLR